MFSKIPLTSTMTSITAKLLANNYIAQTIWPDIIYAMHRCACFSYNPCQEHGEAIVYLVKCLLKTHHLGIKFAPNQTKGFECYVDADFCGNWEKQFAPSDPNTAKPNFRQKLNFLSLKLNTLL